MADSPSIKIRLSADASAIIKALKDLHNTAMAAGVALSVFPCAPGSPFIAYNHQRLSIFLYSAKAADWRWRYWWTFMEFWGFDTERTWALFLKGLADG